MHSLHGRMSKDETATSHRCERHLQKGKSTTKCKETKKKISKINFSMTSRKRTA